MTDSIIFKIMEKIQRYNTRYSINTKTDFIFDSLLIIPNRITKPLLFGDNFNPIER